MSGTYTPGQIESQESSDIERIVLGCIISNDKLAIEVRDLVQPSDFFHPEHVEIFKAIMSLLKRNLCADYLMVLNELKNTGVAQHLPNIVSETTSCCQLTSYSPYLDRYIDILKQKKIHRDFQKLLQEQAAIVSRPVENIYDLVEDFRCKLFEIDRKISTGNGHIDADLYSKEMESVNKKFEFFKKEGKILSSGLITGYKQLDALTNGIEKSSFVIVAARPSVGKTALALNMAYNLSQRGLKSAFFSFEMTSQSIIRRLLSTATKIEYSKIYNGNLTDLDYRIIDHAESKFLGNIVVFDDDEKKVSDIRRKARRMKETKGLDVIFVDYVGLTETSGKKRHENRQNEVTEISASLKDLAKNLNVPVICLSQLSRKPVDRSGPPCMSDLRESGSLEQDGDLIILLSRVITDDPLRKNHIVVDVVKQRNGAIGKFELMYKPETLTFFNVDVLENQ